MKRATCVALFGPLALGVMSCAPSRLAALRQPRIGVVVTPPEAVREEERTTAGVSLTIWHDGSCATLGGTEVLLDGQALSMEHAGGSMTGCLGTKGGAHCKAPTFARATLPSGAMHLVVRDPTATLRMDADDPSTPRSVRVEGDLRAGSDALVRWLPASDSFESYDRPRVTFNHEDGTSWQVVATASGSEVRFTVPQGAKPGRGRLTVSARLVVLALTKCTAPVACRAWLRLPSAGIPTSAVVAEN